MRANSVLSTVVDEAEKSIVIHVAGAAPDGGSKTLTFRADSVHPNNQAYAMLHGFKQRLIDAAALSRDPKSGRSATPAEKFDAIEQLVEHYHSGSEEWNVRVASGERTDGELAMLVRAVCEAKPQATAEKVREWLKSKSKAERAAIAQGATIKPIMDRIRAENAAPVDAEAMLDELA